MNVTITVPTDWLRRHPTYESLKSADSTRRRMVIELLHQCKEVFGVCAVSAAPETAAGAETMRVMLYLPDRLARHVAAVAGRSGLMPGVTIKGLLHLLFKHPTPPMTTTAASVGQSPLGSLLKRLPHVETRPEQIAVFEAIEDALGSGKIGLVEASTGVGKTLATVFAAARWVQREHRNCCVAVPTLALLRQFVAEYRRVAEVEELPPLRTFFGRREFASQASTQAFLLASGDPWPALSDWMASGARPRLDDGIEAAWLVAELRSLEPSFPTHEIVLTEMASADDAGFLAYRQQFSKDAETPSVLLCTHAMLAQDMRWRLRAASRDEVFSEMHAGVFEMLASLSGMTGEEREITTERLALSKREMGEVLATNEGILGILPKYGALIADEGHALETNFSSALSEYVSLKKIVRLLAEYRKEGGRVSATALAEADALVSAIQHSAPARAEYISMASTTLDRAQGILADLVDLLSPLISVQPRDLTTRRAFVLAELRRASNALRFALNQGTRYSYLRLSPHRAFPQLYIARDNVENVLQMLWGSVSAGVALSATLYLYRTSGPHAGVISGLLGIPDARRAEYAPIEASWLHDCIAAIDTPTGDRAQRLRPPSRRDRLDADAYEQRMQLWLDEIAKEIRGIHSQGKGGTLVLSTSYETVAGLNQRLGSDGAKIARTVIAASEGISLTEQAKEFLSQHDQDERPLWIDVGSAWTGLDVGGHANPRQSLLGLPELEGAADNVLCDLVIPRLPFGTNNSVTHLRRIQMRPSIPWDYLDAGFRLRQALGRLVRRKNLPRNRRIHVLDGRLGDPDAAAQLSIFLAPLNRIRERVEARNAMTTDD